MRPCGRSTSTFLTQADCFSNDIHKLDTTNMMWTLISAKGTPARWRDFHSATIIGTKMYVFGGRADRFGPFHSNNEIYCNRIKVFDTETNSWLDSPPTPVLPEGRRSHSAFSYNGELYVFGGYNARLNRHFHDLWKFNPEEYDELEHLVTSRTESVNIDHPNHIVTVTTISDLDLSGARQLGLTTPEGKNDGSGEEKGEEVVKKPTITVPKKSRNPLLSEKISALTATLHMHSKKKTKGKRPQRGQGPHQKIQKPTMRRTTKTQRRRLTGKMGRDQD